MYKQLSLVEREQLFGFKKEGLSLREIGRKLNRSHTTIVRELKRNKILTRGLEKLSGKYLPCRAQEKAEKRTQKQRSEASWKGPEVLLYVKDKLINHLWSPETIAGRITIDHPDLHISHETIYQMIYAPKNKKLKLWTKLTFNRKKRMKKGGRYVKRDGRIPEAVSIDLRPKIVERRKQVGHWETDNVIGKVTDKTALSVTVERKIKLTLISKLTAKTADEKTSKLFERLSVLPEPLRKTMTTDNGVENTNGRIRRFIPKGVSIDGIDEETIRLIEWKMNNTPRKCLGFKTPLEILSQILQNTKTS